MRQFAALLCACALLSACDEDGRATDLAVSTDLALGPDLAVPDLALRDLAEASVCRPEMTFPTFPPPDAGGFCDGTPLAGTCAQAFFARVADCFNPAGCCVGTGSNTVLRGWESGANYRFGMADRQWSLSQNGVSCAGNFPSSATTAPMKWTASDGSELPFFDPTTGELHCPDGSQTNVGAYGQCLALQHLLRPFEVYSCVEATTNTTCCTPYPVNPL
jgi:hypothetical protein